jgi:molybdate transport system permease protein
VLSILLFDQVESLNYQLAHQIAAGLVIASMLVLYSLYRWNRHSAIRVGA